MDNLFKPKEKEAVNTGLGIRNKKLEERLQKEREAVANAAAPVDPKAKGGKPVQAAAPKKEEAKAPPPGKQVKKTP